MSGSERRGSGGWESVLETEQDMVAPGSEWRSEHYRVAVEAWSGENLLERLRAQMSTATARVLEASMLRAVYP